MRHLRLVTQDPVWQAEEDYRPRHLKVVYSAEEVIREPGLTDNSPACRAAFVAKLFLRSRRNVPAGYRLGQPDRVTAENNGIEERMDNDPHVR